MTEENSIVPPAEDDAEDKTRAAMAVVAASLPFVGSGLAATIDSIWVDPYRKRVTGFARAVLERMEHFDVRLTQMEDPDLFETVAARAVRAASRTHEAQKLAMLRNAVVNAALGVEVDDVWSLVLLDLVDELTEAHLLTLSFLNDIVASFRSRGLRDNRPGITRDDYVAELLGTSDTELVSRILRDLDQRQLAHNVGSLSIPGHGTSDAGKRLLRFVAEPFGDSET